MDTIKKDPQIPQRVQVYNKEGGREGGGGKGITSAFLKETAFRGFLPPIFHKSNPPNYFLHFWSRFCQVIRSLSLLKLALVIVSH